MKNKKILNNFYFKIGKRGIDIIGALIFIILFAWLYVICYLLILADSGRPSFYFQKRVGQKGQVFNIYKFRTMVQNADKIGTDFTEPGDKRITKTGIVLRKTSLDEIPQMFNVLKGNMSLVGYRPDVPRSSTNKNERKYQLKPGITGYAQVNGRSCLTEQEKRKWEDKYVDDISFTTDVKILLQTVRVVLKRESIC